MSTSYNRTSSYNRTYEKRVIEESPRVVISNTMRIPQVATAQIQAPFGSIAGTISSQQSGVEDSFSATIDVSQFKAEDLKVAVIGEFIVVEAKHPEREDELGFVERHFIRKFRLPKNVPPEAVTSNLTADGQLTVTAVTPKPKKEELGERTIPIKLVPKSEATEAPQQTNA